MEIVRRSLRFAFYGLWSLVMTAFTYVLGAPGLRVLRRESGRLVYWAIGIAICAALLGAKLKAFSVAFLSLLILVGVLGELELAGLSFLTSWFVTVLINTLLSAGAFSLWVYSSGGKWSAQIQGGLEAVLKPLQEINPKIQINYFDLMLQLPSVILILWLTAVYLAVLLDGRLRSGESPSPWRGELAEIRLPDPLMWLFIGALLGAFGGFKNAAFEAVSVNVLNVCFMLMFFQGIAVVGRFFDSLRMGSLWQFVFMTLIVVHLFLFVSLLGLVDYWMDFRTRIEKRGNEEMNGEI